MPHYRNGREAKEGDRVVGTDSSGYPQAGILTRIQTGSTSCNAQLVPIPSYGCPCVTIGEFLHVEDLPKQEKK